MFIFLLLIKAFIYYDTFDICDAEKLQGDLELAVTEKVSNAIVAGCLQMSRPSFEKLEDAIMNVDDVPVDEFEQALLSINRLAAMRILTECNITLPPFQCVEQLIVPVMERIGKKWEKGKVSLSQVYMSGRICEELLDSLLPAQKQIREPHPGMAICVLCDHHMLGKRIVHSVLRAAGFVLLDYGTVDVTGLVDRVRADGIKLLLISTLMLPSALHVKDVVEELKESRFDIRIVVGGAPFRLDRQLWREVGADAAGYNSSDALAIATQILEQTHGA